MLKLLGRPTFKVKGHLKDFNQYGEFFQVFSGFLSFLDNFKLTVVQVKFRLFVLVIRT